MMSHSSNRLVSTLFSTVICALFAQAGIAQGTLQFGQVKLVSSTETVPAGRVWKATGIMPFQQTSWPTSPVYYTIQVNGNNTTVGHSAYGRATSGSSFGTGSYSSPAVPPVFPLWLPAGATIGTGVNVHAISVIEFIVLP